MSTDTYSVNLFKSRKIKIVSNQFYIFIYSQILVKFTLEKINMTFIVK